MRFIIAGSTLLLLTLQLAQISAIGATRPTELIGGSMNFKGNVVAYPCTVVPGTEEIPVKFGNISMKDLYGTGKSQPQTFIIHLQGCKPGILSSVTVTFSGNENPTLKDHLAITPKKPNGASGIGIGLLDNDDKAISLNVATSPEKIIAESMQLKFKAYVEAEPEAFKNKSIEAGEFFASAYYTLNYQ